MNDQEKSNTAAILLAATVLIEKAKADAVKRGDIGQSIAIANRQAQIESYFKARGVEISDEP